MSTSAPDEGDGQEKLCRIRKDHSLQHEKHVGTTPTKTKHTEKPPDRMNENPIVNPIVTSKGRVVKIPKYLRDYELQE